MTLIIGAICSDGMYFCCDTEEATMLGNKRLVKKLFDTYTNSWSLVIGTAGFGPLCDIAGRNICAIADLAGRSFVGQHESLIGDEMARLYAKYVPDSPDWKRLDRQISLVIGVCDRQSKESYLYRTYEEILQPISQPFACAGVGEGIAEYYLDRLFQDFRPPDFSGRIPRLHEAERFLQFIMKEAKASVGNVGGNTSTIRVDANNDQISHGTFGIGWDAKQPELNQLMEHFWLDSRR